MPPKTKSLVSSRLEFSQQTGLLNLGFFKLLPNFHRWSTLNLCLWRDHFIMASMFNRSDCTPTTRRNCLLPNDTAESNFVLTTTTAFRLYCHSNKLHRCHAVTWHIDPTSRPRLLIHSAFRKLQIRLVIRLSWRLTNIFALGVLPPLITWYPRNRIALHSDFSCFAWLCVSWPRPSETAPAPPPCVCRRVTF